MADEGWERRALEALANDIVVERRRARRWSIFFRLLTLGVRRARRRSLVLGLAGTKGQLCIDKCTAVVHVDGEIDRESRASAENVIEGLHAAFEHPGTKGVVLRINSPGGSPVQAGQIYDEVRRLRAKHPTDAAARGRRGHGGARAATTSPPRPTASTSTRRASSARSA